MALFIIDTFCLKMQTAIYYPIILIGRSDMLTQLFSISRLFSPAA